MRGFGSNMFYDIMQDSEYGHNYRASFFNRKSTIEYFKSKNMNFNKIEYAKLQTIYIGLLK